MSDVPSGVPSHWLYEGRDWSAHLPSKPGGVVQMIAVMFLISVAATFLFN